LKDDILKNDHSVVGFNIGINCVGARGTLNNQITSAKSIIILLFKVVPQSHTGGLETLDV